MTDPKDSKGFVFDQSGKYRIRVLGLLGKSWSDGMEDFEITVSQSSPQEKPLTELVGTVRDQAELSGVLESLYEQHLTLVSVERLESGNHN